MGQHGDQRRPRWLGIGGDGEYLPIVKVAPVYPRRALERGITGDLPGRPTP
jgi:hypothetical protein